MTRTPKAITGSFSAPFLREFWARVVKLGTDKCWPWLGTVRAGEGYGVFRDLGAHRIAYALANGGIRSGLTIDHTCRNRLCCNPAHLEAVTAGENVRRGIVAREGGAESTAVAPARKRTPERYAKRRERGMCVQCNTPSEKYRCDRCRAAHNAKTRARRLPQIGNEAAPTSGDDGYPFDDEEPEDDSERCPECGAFPEEYHDWDCSRGDCDEEDAADCASISHPGCRKCEINGGQ